MRDLLMLGLMLPMVYFASRSAFAAWLFWAWASLSGVQDFMYGFMRGISYVQWFALLTLLLVLMRRDPNIAPQGTRFPGACWLMVGLAVHGLFAATMAYDGLVRNWEIATNLVKIVLLCVLMPYVVTTRQRVQIAVLAIVMAIGVQGVLDGLRFLKSGGGHLAVGNGRLGDRNDYAMHLVVIVPLLVYLFTQLRGKLARMAALGAVTLTVLAVVSTQSRGAMVSLAATALWLVFRSGRKLMAASVVAVGVVLVLTLAPARWFERMHTIDNAAETDASFLGRVEAWKRASAMAIEHPVFGAGFRAVQAQSIFEKYRNNPGFLGWVDTPPSYFPRAAHSIYFEVMSDMGFVGLAWFLAVMFSCFYLTGRARKRAKALGPPWQWAMELAAMVNVSMVGYLVAGAALSVSYVDLPYLLVGLAVVLDRMVSAETERRQAELRREQREREQARLRALQQPKAPVGAALG